eukprot:TRINITY_DN2363_c0_g1_i10.p1 TRINITY_DN2363_c0_g1~~TRINITY_DN2363_c0_g1_i10.p1  ORF type:complete len:285 (-),score=69.11 TRINITY_DN2363_c0_g1_i10:292-1146(-)
MSSRSSREWLDQQQNKKPDPNIAPADEFSLREVIQYARRIEEIDRRMDLAIGDSSERAKKARALYDHTTRLAQNQKVLTQLSRKILEKKERKLREELSKQYRPLIDEEMHRLETSSGAFEKKTRARLKKSWEKGLERRIKVEIEKKKMNEWAPEKLAQEALERIQSGRINIDDSDDDEENSRNPFRTLRQLRVQQTEDTNLLSPKANASWKTPQRDRMQSNILYRPIDTSGTQDRSMSFANRSLAAFKDTHSGANGHHEQSSPRRVHGPTSSMRLPPLNATSTS